MKSIFEDFWNGQIAPYKTCSQNDPEIQELAELVEKNRISLDSELSEKQNKLLKSYVGCYNEYYYLMIVHAFQDGFSLACKLLNQALTEK